TTEAAASSAAAEPARPGARPKPSSTAPATEAGIGRSRGADSKPAVDRARAESAQPQAVIRQGGAHAWWHARAHLQTLRRRSRPARPARTTAAAHGALPARFIVARLFQPAAHASVHQQRFVGLAEVDIRWRILLRVGLLPFRCRAHRRTLKARLRLTRRAPARAPACRSRKASADP